MNSIFQRLSGKLHGLKSLSFFSNFPQLMVERTLFGRTKSVIHRLGNREILIDYSAGEQNGTRVCITHSPYKCFLDEMDLSGKINFLDLGANGGGVPLMLDQLGYQLEKVVAVELNPNTYGRLCFNLYRNLKCSLVLLHAGVADRTGFIDLPLGGGSIGDSIFQKQGVPGGQVTRVPLIALDEVVNTHFEGREVDLCKIDIEGAEFPILVSDAARALSRARHLIIEIHHHPEMSVEWVHRRLDSLGFDLLGARSPYEPNVFGYSRRQKPA